MPVDFVIVKFPILFDPAKIYKAIRVTLSKFLYVLTTELHMIFGARTRAQKVSGN